MNQLLNPRTALVVALLSAEWMLVAPTARAAESLPLSIRVAAVVGRARYEDKNHADWTDLRAGDQLAANPVLQTDTKDSTANIELTGADVACPVAVRLFSNTIVRDIRLGPRTSESAKKRGLLLDLAVGQIRISLDGASASTLNLVLGDSVTHITVPQSDAGSNQTAFLFDGSLTVLKGTIQVAGRSGRETLIHAGEQLRRGASEVTKTPADAPELKVDQ